MFIIDRLEHGNGGVYGQDILDRLPVAEALKKTPRDYGVGNKEFGFYPVICKGRDANKPSYTWDNDRGNWVKVHWAVTAKSKCSKCGNYKEVYGKYRNRRMCLHCHNAGERKRYKESEEHRERAKRWHRVYRKNNKDILKLRDRKKSLIRRYGISIDKYENMFNEQGGVCAICESPPGNKSLTIDHDHKTGKVRKLLCDRCNKSLGLLEENVEIMEHMIEYVFLECGHAK